MFHIWLGTWAAYNVLSFGNWNRSKFRQHNLRRTQVWYNNWSNNCTREILAVAVDSSVLLTHLVLKQGVASCLVSNGSVRHFLCADMLWTWMDGWIVVNQVSYVSKPHQIRMDLVHQDGMSGLCACTVYSMGVLVCQPWEGLERWKGTRCIWIQHRRCMSKSQSENGLYCQSIWCILIHLSANFQFSFWTC